MKKKIIALLLVFGMMFESIGSITSYAGQIQDHEVIDEITSDGSKESVEGAREDNKVEQTTQEDTILVEEDEKGLEKPEEEVAESEVIPDIEKTGGFHGEINVDEHAISVVDKDGNVSYIDVSGDNTIVGETTMFRTATPQIVNLRKTSGVLNYTEVATGEDGYIAGAYGADAAYLGQNNGKVKFMLAGVMGQIEASKVEVVGINSAKSISYYAVSNGRLYHYISTNVNVENYGSVLDNGAAPSYLKSGTKYYSYDGHYFYTEENFGNMIDDYNKGTRTHSVNANSPYYNYFQYLPLRSQSNYSSSTLNTIINNKVSSNSKMKNTGSEFVKKQNTYGVNALLIAGLAANESAWGSSSIAKNKNNLFGLNAVDSSPGQSANYFASVEQCINEFAEKWMSKEYLNPKNWKYFGGFLGNKASGMNVKYASDPYWGEKAAAMAWNLDKANGNKDVNKYTIGIKDVIGPDNTVNIRKDSNTTSTVLFKSPKQGNCAYIVLNQTPVNKFYKIQSDGVLNSGRTAINSGSGAYDFANMYAYISSDYVKIVSKGNGSQTPTEPPISKNGWAIEEGKKYYYENGKKVKGRKKIEGVWYYFETSTGAMQTGWQYIGGKWYYMNGSGAMQTGWQYIGGKWYYMNGSGAMQTGWQYIGGKWYYMNGSGAMQTGWQYIGGKWYYMNGSGAMQTGWQYIGGKWYYMNGSGAMQIGWQYIGGKWYFLESSGKMATKKWIGKYYVNDSGVWEKNKK